MAFCDITERKKWHWLCYYMDYSYNLYFIMILSFFCSFVSYLTYDWLIDWFGTALRFYVLYYCIISLCFSYLATWLPFLNKPIDWLIDWFAEQRKSIHWRPTNQKLQPTVAHLQAMWRWPFETNVIASPVCCPQELNLCRICRFALFFQDYREKT